ncbi:hypothetical protein [Caballeronia arationis]|nr:hypothetical protein [Caballeronia arationis]
MVLSELFRIGESRHQGGLRARVLVSQTKRVTPALESFGSISRREDATKIALEEVKETLKKVWDAIVAAVKKAIEWIKSFWKKLWDNTEPMMKRAEELKAAASKVEGEATEKTFKNAGMAKALHIQGKVPEGAEGAARMAEVAKKVFSDYGAWTAGIEGSTKDLSNVGELAKALDHDAFGLQAVHDAASQGIPVEGEAKVGRSEELPGGNALVVVIAKDIEKSKAGIMPFNKTSGEFKGEDVPVQSKDHMVAVCDAVINIGQAIKANEGAIASGEKAKSQLLKAMDEAQKKDEGQGEAIKAARAALILQHCAMDLHPEELLAEVLSVTTSHTAEELLVDIHAVSQRTIQKIIEITSDRVELEEPEDHAAARQKYLDAYRRFKNHIGGLDLILDHYIASGIDFGYPFMIYANLVGRAFEGMPVQNIAANLVSMAIISTDGFESPRSVIKAHIEDFINDLDILTKADIAIGDLLLKCEIKETTWIKHGPQ